MRQKVLSSCILASALLCTPILAHAQATATSPKPKDVQQPLANLATGVALTADSDVPSSVIVDAVLLPYDVAKRTFGKEIAERYAVVQLTVSNQNPNASLILESAFLDDQHWLFSGNLSLVPEAADKTDSKMQYHSANDPTQVASVEARLVRGELQDAQPFTFRNLFIRSAVAVGTIASGFQFLSASTNVLAGISAYGNEAIPALGLLWPDLSQNRINRISDFGFQTNKVVSKSSSEIVIAFFPIERFLTPTLRALYKKAPAAFFNPLELILDDKYSKTVFALLANAGAFTGATLEAQRAEVSTAFGRYELKKIYEGKKVNCGDDAKCLADLGTEPTLPPETTRLLKLLETASLNRIRVVVGGIMTVDENAVPAIITSVVPDASDTTPLKTGLHTVNIAGTFLGGGVPSVVGADALKITGVTAVAGKSTDMKMVVMYTLGADIADFKTAIPFVVTKTAKDGTQTVSMPVNLAISAAPAVITNFAVDAADTTPWGTGTHKSTIAGTGLTNCKPFLNASPAGFKSFTADTGGTATSVPVTYTLASTIASGTKLHVYCQLPGPTDNDAPINTQPYTYTVP